MKEKYLNDRNGLIEMANTLIAEGKIDEANAKMAEVETLDNTYESSCKAQANLKALQDNKKNTNITNITGGNSTMNNFNNAITDTEDMFATVEYRKAFMNNVLANRDIPSKFMNADANTKTTDVGSVIPTTILEKIIEKIEAVGMILPLVTQTSYKGGLAIPTSSVKPIATWVSEGATSDKQKKTTASIIFGSYKLRCAVSVSLDVDTVALPVFEATFIKNVADAMTKALEQAIISGSGVGQPKGILTETAVVGQALTASTVDYQLLIDAEAALPLEYETDAVYVMTKKTFMAYQSIADTNKQPIARVNFGIDGKLERTLLGRPVVLCNYLDTFTTTLTVGKVFAFLFNFKDYVINTNYNMTIKAYEDNDTDDMITKAIMLADGKVVDNGSLVTIAKKA